MEGPGKPFNITRKYIQPPKYITVTSPILLSRQSTDINCELKTARLQTFKATAVRELVPVIDSSPNPTTHHQECVNIILNLEVRVAANA